MTSELIRDFSSTRVLFLPSSSPSFTALTLRWSYWSRPSHWEWHWHNGSVLCLQVRPWKAAVTLDPGMYAWTQLSLALRRFVFGIGSKFVNTANVSLLDVLLFSSVVQATRSLHASPQSRAPLPPLPEKGGKVRHGIFPEELFTLLYPKTGVTGNYILSVIFLGDGQLGEPQKIASWLLCCGCNL